MNICEFVGFLNSISVIVLAVGGIYCITLVRKLHYRVKELERKIHIFEWPNL